MKVKLVIENFKKGCRETPRKTTVAVDEISAQTKYRKIAGNRLLNDGGLRCKSYGVKVTDALEYTADDLTKAFNDFLKEKWLDEMYSVEVNDGEE